MTQTALATDAYKFSMAQAGFPLRRETFYLSFRKGGWQYVPFDLEEAVREMLPQEMSEGEFNYLSTRGYGSTEAMRHVLNPARSIEVCAVPAGSWVHEREPILSITGPSFLVSWLEPHVLRLFYPIQLATLFARWKGLTNASYLTCTCEEQVGIVRRVADAMGVSGVESRITHDAGPYAERVRKSVASLASVVDLARVFEVGMRAATCEGQHAIALAICQDEGISATSNVNMAGHLGMTPVGTMGHEHVQRWGSDLDAFRAMRDTRVAAPSYLLDTFHTITRGIPAALEVMRETAHECSIRYDSGDKFGQYIYAHGEFRRCGLEPRHVIEDGMTPGAVAKFESLRGFTGLPPEKQVYGVGGYLIDQGVGIGRDDVSAVYKLCETAGSPRMKFGNEEGLGKISVPGRPVVWRRLRGSGPFSMVAQSGEEVPENYVLLSGNPEAPAQLRLCNAWSPPNEPVPHLLSPETLRLVDSLAPTRTR